jgi:hypothetical protein
VKEVRQAVINLGATLVAGFVCALMGFSVIRVFGGEIPVNNRDLAMALVGFIMAEFKQITGFFFNASSREKKQAETIDKQTDVIKAQTETISPALKPAKDEEK